MTIIFGKSKFVYPSVLFFTPELASCVDSGLPDTKFKQ